MKRPPDEEPTHVIPGWVQKIDQFDGWIAKFDRIALAAALLSCALIASSGALLRFFGVASSAWLDLGPRYMTLAIGFIGATLATRLGQHISLDIVTRFASPQWKRWVQLGADVLSTVVACMLSLAAWRFIQFEKEGGSKILNTIPSWVPGCLLLWGFVGATWRSLIRSLKGWAGAPAILVALCAMYYLSYEHVPDLFIWLAMAGLLLAVVCGAPLFIILGGAAGSLFLDAEIDLAAVPIEIYRLTEAPTLATLPLFTLLGGVLAHGGAPHRLVRVGRAWLGWFPGGLAVATVVVCAFFTTFTGASGVTIIALGLLLFEMLSEEGYDENLSLGIVTASGSIGLLFAPALPLIIYGIVAKVDIDQMFVAGVAPGIVLITAVAGAALFLSRRCSLQKQAFLWSEAFLSLRVAMWDLAIPVVVLGLILTGTATAVEASALGAVYVVGTSLFLHKDMRLRDELPKVLVESGLLIGAVLVILGVALSFTGYLVDAEAPQFVVEWVREHIHSKWLFLVALNLLLLAVGCLLDIFSAIIIFVPLLVPVAQTFDVHPVHLGIIFLANLEIGYLTPPVGMNLFLASYRFSRPLPSIWITVIPFLVVLGMALLLITYWPALSLASLGLLD